MEIKYPTSVLLTACGVVPVIYVIALFFKKHLRPLIKVKTNCWFCNKNSMILLHSRNNWLCPHCEQYNGFNEDGGYNKSIASQFSHNMNKLYKTDYPQDDPPQFMNNGFCDKCNLHQTLKVKLLADFEPSCSEYFEQEAEIYKKKLERNYPLCRGCEANLHLTLGKQDSWLRKNVIKWFSSPKRQPSLHLTCSHTHVRPRLLLLVLRHTVVVLSVVLTLCHVYSMELHHQFRLFHIFENVSLDIMKYVLVIMPFCLPLSLLSFVLNLTLIMISKSENICKADYLSICIWTLMILTHRVTPIQHLVSEYILKAAISIICVILSLWNVTFKSHCVTIESPDYSGSSDSCYSKDLNESLSDDYSLNTTLIGDESFSDESTLVKQSAFTPIVPKTPLESIGCTMKNLKISEQSHSDLISSSVNCHSPFNHSLHSSKSANICRPSTPLTYNGLLSPPKLSLKPITQSSWVAGGFWGATQYSTNNQTLFEPISRSSSQSSGFISNSSNAHFGRQLSRPSSPCESYFSDYERHSVFSEPRYNHSCVSRGPQSSSPISVSSMYSCRSRYPSNCLSERQSHTQPEVVVVDSSVYFKLIGFSSLLFFLGISLCVNMYLGCYYLIMTK